MNRVRLGKPDFILGVMATNRGITAIFSSPESSIMTMVPARSPLMKQVAREARAVERRRPHGGPYRRGTLQHEKLRAD
jgi:hypothetical protein